MIESISAEEMAGRRDTIYMSGSDKLLWLSQHYNEPLGVKHWLSAGSWKSCHAPVHVFDVRCDFRLSW